MAVRHSDWAPQIGAEVLLTDGHLRGRIVDRSEYDYLGWRVHIPSEDRIARMVFSYEMEPVIEEDAPLHDLTCEAEGRVARSAVTELVE